MKMKFVLYLVSIILGIDLFPFISCMEDLLLLLLLETFLGMC